ncbi:MAG: ATP-binding cassette domain-containing protein [Sphaerochaeta sp.]|nr:ATP-binding cassette domain-containing protein [Sphaerochaeta sp.]
MSYLEIKELDKKYTAKGPLIVDKMNLSIDQGEFIVFLGPSGCGKTTTIRMIAGLEEVTGGDITIEGESILDKLPKDRGVSMIFQSYAIWPHFTVFENIAYPLKLQKIDKNEIRKRVEKAAQVTQIDNLLDRYPSQMSGGQRQRVAVSRAIVVNPKIFLMDEPLSNLDAKLRVSMRTDLRDIHDKLGTTSIFVTHDQSEAMSLADRIIIMNRGRIEQIGTPVEVYQQSATKFVAGFIGTPPTNFFEVTITEADKKLIATGGGVQLSLSKKDTERLSSYKGKTVDMGIRPEYLGIVPLDGHLENSFATARIDFIEQQGSHAILIATIGTNTVKIETSDFMNIKAKSEVQVFVKKEMVSFFDKETTLRI